MSVTYGKCAGCYKNRKYNRNSEEKCAEFVQNCEKVFNHNAFHITTKPRVFVVRKTDIDSEIKKKELTELVEKKFLIGRFLMPIL